MPFYLHDYSGYNQVVDGGVIPWKGMLGRYRTRDTLQWRRWCIQLCLSLLLFKKVEIQFTVKRTDLKCLVRWVHEYILISKSRYRTFLSLYEDLWCLLQSIPTPQRHLVLWFSIMVDNFAYCTTLYKWKHVICTLWCLSFNITYLRFNYVTAVSDIPSFLLFKSMSKFALSFIFWWTFGLFLVFWLLGHFYTSLLGLKETL